MNAIRSFSPASEAHAPVQPRPAGRGYATNWEHIEDELARLHLRLQIAMPPSQACGPSAQTLQEALEACDKDIEARRHASEAAGIPLALPRLARLFQLSALEEQCLLACLAAELDVGYQKQYASLQHDPARTYPCAALLLDLLCGDPAQKRAARRIFSPRSPLLTYRLLQPVNAGGKALEPALSHRLRIDPRIADHLIDDHRLGSPAVDDRVQPFVRLLPHGPEPAAAGMAATQATGRMLSFIRHHLASSPAPQGLVFQLHGPDAAAQRLAVEAIGSALALQVVWVDAGRVAASPASTDLAWLIGREAVLLPAALCVEPVDAWFDDDKNAPQRESWFAAIRHFSQLTFLLGRQPGSPGPLGEGLLIIEVAFPNPDVQDRTALWEAGLAAHRVQTTVEPGVLASRFRFDAGQISLAMQAAETLAYWRDPAGRTVHADDIVQACRRQVSTRVSAATRQAVPLNRWDQLVLPPDHLRQLRELCDQARHRHIVYGRWGFARRLAAGNGLNALFTGPPGTGKTMAAEVVAAELQADLFKIDLSQTVSKYIGETEKNLEQVFRDAESGNAILFFDEADALFGKRSEVKDAHDRYANIETGYLLQRMEHHEGIVLLATNLRNNLDEAFCRRMHFVIEFPFPDEVHRARLWEGLFPPEVPRDEALDFRFMARQFKVSGGNIRNIGVCAAFLAAAEGRGLSMRHLILATRREYKKLGWPCSANDFGAYHDLLKALDG